MIQILGLSTDGEFPVMILEFCASGSLDKLVAKTKLDQQTELKIIKGTALGMLHLHKNNIIHRDLAARNILVHGVHDASNVVS